jgi:FKBP-type peptidyl-prolyl cis-trans isomerase 2
MLGKITGLRCALALGAMLTANAAVADGAIVAAGKKVTLEYTLALDDGRIIDSTTERGAFTYEHGVGALLPALEEELEGTAQGTTRSIVLPPSRAYGEHVADGVHDVPTANLPEELRMVGQVVRAQTEQGNRQALVVAVNDEVVTLDFNHPLAGKNLHYEVTVVRVE